MQEQFATIVSRLEIAKLKFENFPVVTPLLGTRFLTLKAVYNKKQTHEFTSKSRLIYSRFVGIF